MENKYVKQPSLSTNFWKTTNPLSGYYYPLLIHYNCNHRSFDFQGQKDTFKLHPTMAGISLILGITHGTLAISIYVPF
jgi:hypothetical protein